MWIECGHWLTFGSTEWIENGSEQWMVYQYQSVRRMVSSNRRICQLRMGKKSHFLCYTKSKGKKSHFLANNQMCNKRQQLSSIYNWQQHRLGLEKNNLLTAEGVGKVDLLFENLTKKFECNDRSENSAEIGSAADNDQDRWLLRLAGKFFGSGKIMAL